MHGTDNPPILSSLKLSSKSHYIIDHKLSYKLPLTYSKQHLMHILSVNGGRL